MNNIISSADPSETLNASVKNVIAKHLFLVCNYNPESVKAYSTDAKFIVGVMNMYKFLIDTSICNSLSRFKKDYCLSTDIDALDKIIKQIASIRTLIGHNEDDRNGIEDNKELAESWFSKTIGKKYPESVEEYDLPLKQIEQYGYDSIRVLNSFVQEVAKHYKKSEIVTDLEKEIISFYKRKNSKNIFKGNLKIAYRSRVGLSKKVNDKDIADWTQKMMTFNEDNQISTLRASLLRVRKDIRESIVLKIDQYQESKQRIIEQVAAACGKSEKDLGGYDYLDYYCTMFPQRICDELENGNVESLLPQEIVQAIIQSDFASVPV